MSQELKILQSRIHSIRSEKVMLASDLAEIYGVETRALNQSVKRNPARFPSRFMFQLTAEEAASLKSQSVTSSWGGARRALPYAFTEHGAVMLAAVLNSQRAVQMSLHVVQAFVNLGHLMMEHKELSKKIEALEGKVGKHDKQLQEVIGAIRLMFAPPNPEDRKIKGFGK
jgi:phage regulator Rha-like protein